ncbi:MAG TPA: hypothetical protein PK535_09840 [Synergistaceae bacterium]|jgi:hypothetical protein|nr:hypothetical protein [Synergistaceae bacterium]
MFPAQFTLDGEAFKVARGRVSPGLPSWRVVRANGAHVSLLYPEGENTGLFDFGAGRGYRLDLEAGTAEAMEKAAYYRAREACGYPIRRRRKKAAVL